MVKEPGPLQMKWKWPRIMAEGTNVATLDGPTITAHQRRQEKEQNYEDGN